MEQDFIYWRHRTPVGIKVEEISGGMQFKARNTRESLALQIYCENGRDGYRRVGHFDNGAPYIDNGQSRISITHTTGFLAVATLPRTPEADLRVFSQRTAMGIDAEPLDREKVLSLRERFLNPAELQTVPAGDVAQNISAWTAKEALYKAAMTPGLDWRSDIVIESLPTPMTVRKGSDGKPVFEYTVGSAVIAIEGRRYDMELFCYDSDGIRVMLAYSPKCAKFMRNNPVD